METLQNDGKISGLEFEGLQVLLNNPGLPLSPYFEDPNLQDVYYQTMDQISYGKLTVDEAAKYMFDNINNVLDKITK